MGSHVAPSHQLKWHVSKIVLGSMGFEPMTTTKPNTLRNGPLPMRHINVYVKTHIIKHIVWFYGT
jgi:hypothetical protein